VLTSIHSIFQSGAIRAVLLDHAGVLVDIENLHGQARARLFNQFGCNLTPADGKSMMGFGEKKLFEYMQAGIVEPSILGRHLPLLEDFKRVVEGFDGDWQAFKNGHEKMYETLYAQIDDPRSLVTAGLTEFHMAAYERGIPEGIVSNSARAHVMADAALNIQRFNQLCFAKGKTEVEHGDLFRVTLTADDMKEMGVPTKPSMAPYLIGAARMQAVQGLENMRMSEILCVEDSKIGVASAEAAGLLVIERIYDTEPGSNASIRNAKAFGWVDEYGRMDQIELNPAHPVAKRIMDGAYARPAAMALQPL